MNLSGALDRARVRLARAIYPAAAPTGLPLPEHAADAPLNLLYARGFLLTEGRPPSSAAGWRAIPIGRRTLYVDPRVPVQQASAGGRSAWLLGDAFDPVAGVYQAVAAYLLDGDLLERLDQTAGRFVLFVQEGERVEIYHDAMGSRSVFYSDGGVVASHSALVAEVIGSGLREWILPFITSRNFTNRDVKYLPGLDSPFDDVVQLTPNTRLVLPDARVERYWPREPGMQFESPQALAALIQHMKGLQTYLEKSGLRPVVGLSGGRDSRTVLAALAAMSPHVFTFVRSARGDAENSKDSRVARELTARCDLELDIVRVTAPPPLDETATHFAAAFRRNTGFVRGNNARWIEQFHEKNEMPDAIFVRGFGGEVMRGFYGQISAPTSAQLSNTYDVNAGSRYSREAFARFIERTGWTTEALRGYQLSDIFYWEHRMGIWGASALAESDMAFRTLPGYNSRSLFRTFMGLPTEARDTSTLFESATAQLKPELAGVSYDS